jgi:thioredoxin 1
VNRIKWLFDANVGQPFFFGTIFGYYVKNLMTMTISDLKTLTAGERFVLVDFYAHWCGPCKAMHSVLDSVQQQLSSLVDIVRVDIDRPENSVLADHFRINAVPTLVLFREGRQLWRRSGVMSVEELVGELRHQERLEFY